MFEALPLTSGEEQSQNIEYVCLPHQWDCLSLGTCQFRTPATWEDRQGSRPWALVGVNAHSKRHQHFLIILAIVAQDPHQKHDTVK